ncbi:hypothetical protein FH972_017709 [Carpinus fangiana]|uniref:Uncharacterized protein n=1 Tax=Carpinus fangiana TaxID=176857 RepID=A0A5N6RJY8_9ROSI|nr:hypothetical protein FH972_017709 [Carpinus fangiana]
MTISLSLSAKSCRLPLSPSLSLALVTVRIPGNCLRRCWDSPENVVVKMEPCPLSSGELDGKEDNDALYEMVDEDDKEDNGELEGGKKIT